MDGELYTMIGGPLDGQRYWRKWVCPDGSPGELLIVLCPGAQGYVRYRRDSSEPKTYRYDGGPQAG